MANRSVQEQLQPALFDRLADELETPSVHRDESYHALDRLLDAPGRAALADLFEQVWPEDRTPELPEALVAVDGAASLLLGRVLEREVARRQRARRAVALSGPQLRAAIMRDLETLLNSTSGESQPGEAPDFLARWPMVRSSALNYGIPALAGRIRTGDDMVMLARQIELAIDRYEPRLRVRVRQGEAARASPDELTFSSDLVIEGELWGYPVAEHIVVRTILDLDAGHIDLREAAQAP